LKQGRKLVAGAVGVLLLTFVGTFAALGRDVATSRQGARGGVAFSAPERLREWAEQRMGNCSDSGVGMWLSFDHFGGVGGLHEVVPTGCGAAALDFSSSDPVDTLLIGASVPPGLANAYIAGSGSSFRQLSIPNETAQLKHQEFLAASFGTGDGTVEAWVNADASQTAGTPFAIAYGGGSNLTSCGTDCDGCWHVVYAGGVLKFNVVASSNCGGPTVQTCTTASGPPADGTWHYMRATWVNATGTCTMNWDVGNTSAATNALMIGRGVSTADPSTSSGIMVGNNTGGNGFDGKIADVRISQNATNNLGVNDGTRAFTSAATAPGPNLSATFTRATTSTRYNPQTQLLEAVPAGTPVVGAPLQSTGALPLANAATGVYAGSATTFGILNNDDFTVATGSNTTTVTANQVTAPDGTLTADLLTTTGANSNLYNSGSSACTETTACVCSVWLKSTTNANVTWPGGGVYTSTGGRAFRPRRRRSRRRGSASPISLRAPSAVRRAQRVAT
jgi:hypothetical protein